MLTKTGCVAFYDNISPLNIPQCAIDCIDCSSRGLCIPIVSLPILREVIEYVGEMGEPCRLAEFITKNSRDDFYTYTPEELYEWPDCIDILGCVGLVLDPKAPIKLLFPRKHGL